MSSWSNIWSWCCCCRCSLGIKKIGTSYVYVWFGGTRWQLQYRHRMQQWRIRRLWCCSRCWLGIPISIIEKRPATRRQWPFFGVEEKEVEFAILVFILVLVLQEVRFQTGTFFLPPEMEFFFCRNYSMCQEPTKAKVHDIGRYNCHPLPPLVHIGYMYKGWLLYG